MNYQKTSLWAWEEFVPVSAALDRLIMDTLSRAGRDGLTCELIEAAIQRSHQAVSGNLTHLVERGLVVPTGTYGVTRSGCRAKRWRVFTGDFRQRNLFSKN